MKKYFITLILVAISITTFGSENILDDDHNNHTMPVKLEQGHYFGNIEVDQQNQKFPLEADIFLESPEDLAQFPQLNVILKISLGSFNSTEYSTQVYKNVRYDFDNNILTLDEPSNDLIVSAQVQSRNGRTHLQGSIWIRSIAKNATLDLELESDEPGDSNQPISHAEETIPYVTNLQGQYVGQCKGKKATFQILTTRGLRNQDSREGKYLFDYEIVAYFGYWQDGSDKSTPRPWTLYSTFAGGIYNFFNGKLFFHGPSSTGVQCIYMNSKLECKYQSREGSIPCQFEPVKKTTAKYSKYQRRFHLSPSAEQLKDLPQPSPPSNSEIIKALGGHFVGYLHHENYDRYQPVALHVVPSSSTDNPHNPNNIFVSSTSVLYFGTNPSELFISQRYEPRSFYMRPGFTLSAPGTDSFIVIDVWKNSFIRGVWYSHEFGRVGTIELIKNDTVDIIKEISNALPSTAKVVQPWQGEFQGDPSPDDNSVYRWFDIEFPNQPAERLESTVLYFGSYMVGTSITPMKQIERGRYDPYTGAMGWLINENNGIGMVSGRVEDDGNISLYWPPAPKLFQASMGNYKLETFKVLK